MIKTYTNLALVQSWLARHQIAGRSSLTPSTAKSSLKSSPKSPPLFVCVLGFTATGLIEGISAAGATAADRMTTAIADAEFLALGKTVSFPLPPLIAGASPVLISRAVIESLGLPYVIVDAGLPIKPTIPHLTLGHSPAQCLSTGRALPRDTVINLFWQGYDQGKLWASGNCDNGENGINQARSDDALDYLILSECVVGGTTTALAVLTALGFPAHEKVNSSHPICNHAAKWQLVQKGCHAAGWQIADLNGLDLNPFDIVAAVGDPMQITVAGMILGATAPSANHSGTDVLLAGGTQMLAVYALAERLAVTLNLPWQPERIIVGTTRWVAEDPTGNTVALAQILGDVPLIATELNFGASVHEQLRAYEQGFVKEGVGAGGAAIAASLWANWGQAELLAAVEVQMERVKMARVNGSN